MKTLDKKYSVIRENENDVYRIVNAEDIKHDVYKFELPGYDHTDANDYSLYNANPECQAAEDMMEAGVSAFGESFRMVRFFAEGADERLVVDLDDLGDLNGRVEEIEKFINDWEAGNAEYCKVDAYIYWDGSNEQAVITEEYDNIDFPAAYEELSDEEAAPILDAWENIGEFESNGLGWSEAHADGYKFEHSEWEQDWGHVTVTVE